MLSNLIKTKSNKTAPDLSSVFVFSLSLFVFLPVSVQAGFEWHPAPKVEKMMVKEVEPVASKPKVELLPQTKEIAPAIVEEVDLKDAVSSNEMPQEHIKTSALVQDKGERKVVMGFGSDIPLAFALRQIVPAEYAFSFDTSVNPALKISWNGGKPWDVILYDSLSPHGLGVSVVDRTVWVRPLTSSYLRPTLTPMSPSTAPASVTEVEELPVYPPEPVLYQMSGPGFVESNYDISQEKNYAPSYPRRNPMPMMMKTQESVSGPENLLNNVEPSGYPEPIHATRNDAIPATYMPNPDGFASDVQLGQSVNVLDPFEIKFWQAHQGQSLFSVLSAWSERSNVELRWSYEGDYLLPMNVNMHGTYPDAIQSILMSYDDLDDRPIGRLHPNLPNGPSVLIIESTQ